MNKKIKNQCSKCQTQIQEIDKTLKEFKEIYGESMPM
jgi:hypothetical protein